MFIDSSLQNSINHRASVASAIEEEQIDESDADKKDSEEFMTLQYT
jgi:hypothetical protein